MHLFVQQGPDHQNRHHHFHHHHDNHLAGEPAVQQDHGSDQQKLWTATESLQSPSECICKCHIFAIKSSHCGLAVKIWDSFDRSHRSPTVSNLLSTAITIVVNTTAECPVSDGDPRMTLLTQTSPQRDLQFRKKVKEYDCEFVKRECCSDAKYTNLSIWLNAKLFHTFI